VPADAKSLALIMFDPDAPGGDYNHWLVWDIPAGTIQLAANTVPVGAVQGLNSSGQNNYAPPCPPSGMHRYIFELYALNSSLNLPAQTNKTQLLAAISDKAVARSTLTGTFGQ
jgi:Raf kinase inhibitor-like YbhB/YbcL family protein